MGWECSGASFRQSEVEDLGMTELGHKNVGGLDVAMNDALGVSGIERPGNVYCQFEQLVGRKRPAQDALAQRRPFQQFHHDEILTILLADLVDGADVRMVERRGGAGLALEPFQSGSIRAEFRGKKLQGHVPAEGFVLRLVNHAHPAATQLADDTVVRDGLSDHGYRSWFSQTLEQNPTCGKLASQRRQHG